MTPRVTMAEVGALLAALHAAVVKPFDDLAQRIRAVEAVRCAPFAHPGASRRPT